MKIKQLMRQMRWNEEEKRDGKEKREMTRAKAFERERARASRENEAGAMSQLQRGEGKDEPDERYTEQTDTT
jgi:hypothetical protein